MGGGVSLMEKLLQLEDRLVKKENFVSLSEKEWNKLMRAMDNPTPWSDEFKKEYLEDVNTITEWRPTR